MPKTRNNPKIRSNKYTNTQHSSQKNTKISTNTKNKNEIKFLYRKKQLNTELYHMHIQSASNWQHIWHNIEQSINQKLQREMVEIHKTQQQKIQTLSKTKTTDTKNKDNSYPGVVNTTDTQFTKEEIHLLNKGLQYNLHHKQKNWIETALNNLDIAEQQYYRHAVGKTLIKITQKNEHNSDTHNKEWKAIRNIKKKLTENNLTITRADKGKTTVILILTKYEQKVNDFIKEHKITEINSNPTQKYQKRIKQILKQNKNITQKEHTWKYTNMNPTPPILLTTIKLHKPGTPIRPIIIIINWKNTPAYKLAKHIAKLLHNDLQLPYTYNIQDSKTLITELKTIQIDRNTRICSLNIKNMYTNIPRTETTNNTQHIKNQPKHQ
jgi:hypothetical protein